MGFFSKIINGLKKTKDAIASKLAGIFSGRFDDDFYEELEFVLISSDMGVTASNEIVENLKKEVKKQKIKSEEELKTVLRKIMAEILTFEQDDEEFPVLYTIVGVNGVGKTTAIGKIANLYTTQKKKVLMVAGDTFRAAASDQLTEWSKRSKCRIVKYNEGVDPASVIFDGIKSALAKNDDVVLVDTAGRLQNKANLMEELRKINKIVTREWQGKTENLLVIDATTGQNALSQVEVFNDIVGLDGIILTKLDGTAKGGVVFAIAKQYNLPVKFIGIGEGIDDLQVFDPIEFANNII